MNFPKYALFEHERRFVVDPARCPDLDRLAFSRIDDLYIDATRLRLRRVTAPGADAVYKLCRKYLWDDTVSAPITNLYLTAAEFEQLDMLPGQRIAKRRYRIDGFALDIFEPPHAGLIIAEVEAATRDAVMAIVPPGWIGREITGEAGFSGAVLAQTAGR